jgi:hypothetical protein
MFRLRPTDSTALRHELWRRADGQAEREVSPGWQGPAEFSNARSSADPVDLIAADPDVEYATIVW